MTIAPHNQDIKRFADAVTGTDLARVRPDIKRLEAAEATKADTILNEIATEAMDPLACPCGGRIVERLNDHDEPETYCSTCRRQHPADDEPRYAAHSGREADLSSEAD